jgi:hypothetical protein
MVFFFSKLFSIFKLFVFRPLFEQLMSLLFERHSLLRREKTKPSRMLSLPDRSALRVTSPTIGYLQLEITSSRPSFTDSLPELLSKSSIYLGGPVSVAPCDSVALKQNKEKLQVSFTKRYSFFIENFRINTFEHVA